MRYPDYLQPILARINPDYGVHISCDSGWWTLISNCDKELSAVDPDYTIFQVKEKFGGLRYYYSPSNPDNRTKMDEIVRKYEKICAMTCELTGRHGYLLRKGKKGMGMLKTLNEGFLQEGWERVESNLLFDIDTKSQSE